MKLKKAGTHASAHSVQKGQRLEYILSGIKYVGTVIRPLPDTREFEVQPDGVVGTHVVQEGKGRLVRATKRHRSMEYAVRNNIPVMD